MEVSVVDGMHAVNHPDIPVTRSRCRISGSTYCVRRSVPQIEDCGDHRLRPDGQGEVFVQLVTRR